MPPTAPLQIILFRDLGDREALPYEDAIVRAFQGGKEAGGYLATGEDMGIQLEVFSTAPDLDPATKLDNFCHSLTVVIADRCLLDNADDLLWDWWEKCWTFTDASKGRHAIFVVAMD